MEGFCEEKKLMSKLLSIFAKGSFLDIWQGSKYASDSSSKAIAKAIDLEDMQLWFFNG